MPTAGLPPVRAEAIVLGIPAEGVPCDQATALRAGLLATLGKPLELSLGDRNCLATAQIHGGVVLTAEQAWRKISLEGVPIEVIRDPQPAGPATPKGH